MTFKLFSKKMQELIDEKGFLEPTLPQKIGIPEILDGKSVIIVAQTGLGKTESAMLPILDKIYQEKTGPISALYITPLRALNRDLMDRLCWWASKLDLDIAVRHGDTSQRERIVQREMPSHILITTPESLQAILTGKKLREHLKNVKYVIVDEIHELLESKRGTQLTLGLERLRELAGNFQRIGISATIGDPKVAASWLNASTIVDATSEKIYNINVEAPTVKKKDIVIAEELFIKPDSCSKVRRLHELINSHKSVLVFTNTRETAELLSSRLMSLGLIEHAVHHGSISKERRIASEQRFKSQNIRALIATSSLELGIDIGAIDLVVQYLSPRQITRLLQRVGRAGHGVGRVSKGIIISGGEDEFEASVVVKRALERKFEKINVHECALDVLCHQIIGIVMDAGRDTDHNYVYDIVKRAWPYRNLTIEEFEAVLKFMKKLGLVWFDEGQDPKNRTKNWKIRRQRRSIKYYFENLSTIPESLVYRVISIIEQEPVGVLGEAFVAEHCKTGEKFILSGRTWQVIQVDSGKVMVEPASDIGSAIPSWEGELIPVSYQVARDVGRLRKERVKDTEILRKHCEKNTLPDDKTILIEKHGDFIIFHLCAGSKINDTIGKYIAAKIADESGASVNMRSDPYRIVFQTLYDTKALINLITSSDIDTVIKSDIVRSTTFKWRFLHVARRFGVISRGAIFEKVNIGKVITQYEESPVYKETLREVMLEKLDIDGAKSVIEKIENQEIKIKIEDGLSVLGDLGLQHSFGELIKPALPAQEIFTAFKRRILLTRLRLLCMNCAEWTTIKAVMEVDQQPECPECGSRLISVLRKRSTIMDIVKRKTKRKQISESENKMWLDSRRAADLVIAYGKPAVITLAGRGVGPRTAARILAMLHPTEDKLLHDILKAEKEFARTKKFWK